MAGRGAVGSRARARALRTLVALAVSLLAVPVVPTVSFAEAGAASRSAAAVAGSVPGGGEAPEKAPGPASDDDPPAAAGAAALWLGIGTVAAVGAVLSVRYVRRPRPRPAQQRLDGQIPTQRQAPPDS